MKRTVGLCLIGVLPVLLTAGSAAARPVNSAVGTSFTYQGTLTVGGSPANGAYDFEFRLFDDLGAGSQIGGTVAKGSVPVANGLFTVQLDFGDVFDGTALWLQIGVAPGGNGGPYNTLDPRQRLSPTPYAMFAARAPWEGLLDMPAGFADGEDNGSSYQNIVVVAKSGGDFTSIQSALDSITTAGASNRFLVHVAPGVYAEQVTMKRYVDIEGSGEMNTKVTFTGSTVANTGTIIGADDAELRFLTAENTGGQTLAIAIYNNASTHLIHVTATAEGGTLSNYGLLNDSFSPTVTNVTASAKGGARSYAVFNRNAWSVISDVSASATGATNENYGVYNEGGGPELSNVLATASGQAAVGVYNSYGTYRMWNVTARGNTGVWNDITSTVTMTDVVASGGGGGQTSVGVRNSGGSSVTMTNVTASAEWADYNNFGVQNNPVGPLTMTNVTVSAKGGMFSVGVYHLSSGPVTMSNVNISATGGESNYGLFYNATSGSNTVLVNNSQITGSTNTIRGDSEFTTRLGGSKLDGGPVSTGGGTVTCAGVYDENYVFYTSTCP